MKIKIIELVAKWLNAEEMPKKIKYDGSIFNYSELEEDYMSNEGGNGLLDLVCMFSTFTEDIEIIEEPKKIEKLEHCKGYNWFLEIDDYIEHLRTKIDELIDEINKLKED